MEPSALPEVVQQGGIITFALVVLVGGAKEWWVYGRHYRDALNDRDEWKRMALQGSELADRAVQVASTTTRRG